MKYAIGFGIGFVVAWYLRGSSYAPEVRTVATRWGIGRVIQ